MGTKSSIPKLSAGVTTEMPPAVVTPRGRLPRSIQHSDHTENEPLTMVPEKGAGKDGLDLAMRHQQVLVVPPECLPLAKNQCLGVAHVDQPLVHEHLEDLLRTKHKRPSHSCADEAQPRGGKQRHTARHATDSPNICPEERQTKKTIVASKQPPLSVEESGHIDSTASLPRVLSEVARTAPASSGGYRRMRLPGISLHVAYNSQALKSIGEAEVLRHPLTIEQARFLAAVGEHRSYGISQPPTWQWTADEITFSNQQWDSEVRQLAAEVLQEAGIPTASSHLEVPHLFKMIYCGSAAGYHTPQKWPNCCMPRLLASLWIFPPATYTGGVVTAQRQDGPVSVEYDIATFNEFEFAYVCQFRGSIVALHPLKTGHRLCLVYSICSQAAETAGGQAIAIRCHGDESTLRSGLAAVAKWRKEADRHSGIASATQALQKNRYIFMMERCYGKVSFESLKSGTSACVGNDAKVVKFLNTIVARGGDLDWDIGALDVGTSGRVDEVGGESSIQYRNPVLDIGQRFKQPERVDTGVAVLHTHSLGKLDISRDLIHWSQRHERTTTLQTDSVEMQRDERNICNCIVIWPRSKTYGAMFDQQQLQLVAKYLDESTVTRFASDKHWSHNRTILEHIMEAFESDPRIFEDQVHSLVNSIVRFGVSMFAEALVQHALAVLPYAAKKRFVQHGLPLLLNKFREGTLVGWMDWCKREVENAAQVLIECGSECTNKEVAWKESLLHTLVEATCQMANGCRTDKAKFAMSLGVYQSHSNTQGSSSLTRWPLQGVGGIVQLLCQYRSQEVVTARFIGAIGKAIAEDRRCEKLEIASFCDSLYAESQFQCLQRSCSFTVCLKELVLALPLQDSAEIIRRVLSLCSGSQSEPQSAVTSFSIIIIKVYSPKHSHRGRHDVVWAFIERVAAARTRTRRLELANSLGCNVAGSDRGILATAKAWPEGLVGTIVEFVLQSSPESPDARRQAEMGIHDFVASILCATTSGTCISSCEAYEQVTSDAVLRALLDIGMLDACFNEMLQSADFDHVLSFAARWLKRVVKFQHDHDMVPLARRGDDFIASLCKRLFSVCVESHMSKLSASIGMKRWSHSSFGLIVRHLVGAVNKKSIALDVVFVCTRAILIQDKIIANCGGHHGNFVGLLSTGDIASVFQQFHWEEVRDKLMLQLLDQLETGDVAYFVTAFSKNSRTGCDDFASHTILPALDNLALALSKTTQSSSYVALLQKFLRYLLKRLASDSSTSESLSKSLLEWPQDGPRNVLHILCNEQDRSTKQGQDGSKGSEERSITSEDNHNFLVTICRALVHLPRYKSRGMLFSADIQLALSHCEVGGLCDSLQPAIEELYAAGKIDLALFLLLEISLGSSSAQKERCTRFLAEVRNHFPTSPTREWTFQAVISLIVLVANVEGAGGDIACPYSTKCLRKELLGWELVDRASLLEQAEVWFSLTKRPAEFAIEFLKLAKSSLADTIGRIICTVPKESWRVPDVPPDAVYPRFLANHCRRTLQAHCKLDYHNLVRESLKDVEGRNQLRIEFFQPAGPGSRWFIRLEKLHPTPFPGTVPPCKCRERNRADCPVMKYHRDVARNEGVVVTQAIVDRLTSAKEFFSQMLEGSHPSPEVEVVDLPQTDNDNEMVELLSD